MGSAARTSRTARATGRNRVWWLHAAVFRAWTPARIAKAARQTWKQQWGQATFVIAPKPAAMLENFGAPVRRQSPKPTLGRLQRVRLPFQQGQ
jgi:hypothetical protein